MIMGESPPRVYIIIKLHANGPQKCTRSDHSVFKVKTKVRFYIKVFHN